MKLDTYSRGKLVWVDDRFSHLSAKREQYEQPMWHEIFGSFSDRVFRLMDLSLEIACDFEEALEMIESAKSSQSAGTFVQFVVDLSIPRRTGEVASVKYGVATAQELRNRDIPFVFLSANSHATEMLDKAKLGNFPYYVKEFAGGLWRFPESLSRVALNDFRRNISWVSVAEAAENLDANSDVLESYRADKGFFEYFPFFGPFRDFVERWEHKDSTTLPKAFVIRATPDHNHKFIQQTVLLMLTGWILRHPKRVRISYGRANDPEHRKRTREMSDNANLVSVLRVAPRSTTPDELEQLLSERTGFAGTMIYVIPNDESADRYSDILRQNHIPVLEELPQSQWGDVTEREELVRRSCALMFQQWSLQSESGGRMPLPLGYLEYPELLINPIFWSALHEARDVSRELSDPYEILKELHDTLREIDENHNMEFRRFLELDCPVPYSHLLRVGEGELRKHAPDGMREWIESALDNWLQTSWQFPYSLEKQFTNAQNARDEDEQGHCVNWQRWQDHCYLSTLGMLEEYEKEPKRESMTARQFDLLRIRRFIKTLGEDRFLGQDGFHNVDWESLESLRWPHHRYAMPAAVNQRLKQAGRYLWIQPERLDVAASLPGGRLRYYFLADFVEQYSTVLAWAERTVEFLPEGWRQSVSYLVDVIREHRIATCWQSLEHRKELWQHLEVLQRNGPPIMYITARLILQRSFDKLDEKSPRAFLSSIGGAGVILHLVEKSRHERLGGFLKKQFTPRGSLQYTSYIDHACEMFGFLKEQSKLGGDTLATETFQSVTQLLLAMQSGNDPSCEGMFQQFAEFMCDDQNGMAETSGWSHENQLKDLAESFVSDSTKPANILMFPETAIFSSLLRSKGDYFWQALDVVAMLNHIAAQYRNFDGYHLLGALNDWRVFLKGETPTQRLPQAERILELFLNSIEGLVAQLAWCLKVAGHEERANRILPPTVSLHEPDGYSAPSAEEVAALLRVEETGDRYRLGTLGIPGSGVRNKHCYQATDGNCIRVS